MNKMATPKQVRTMIRESESLSLNLLILRRIKRLKVKELKLVAEKLDIISYNKYIEWRANYNADAPHLTYAEMQSPTVTMDDIQDAFIYCIYHFDGKRLESIDGNEQCPCNCWCEKCEMIPESSVLIRMQELGTSITNENVMNEFIEQYSLKSGESNGK